MKRLLFVPLAIVCILLQCCKSTAPRPSASLPRAAAVPEALARAMDSLWTDADSLGVRLQSVMVVSGDSVIYEHWSGGGHADSLHGMWSVSKTFTALAIGLAIDEGLLRLDEPIVDIFPEYVTDSASPNLARIDIESLLTMSCGQAREYYSEACDSSSVDPTLNWVRFFMSKPVEYGPDSVFCYNTLGSFVLSAAIQRRSGQTLFDYLTPRLFEPLGIKDIEWATNPEGINLGGTGLRLHTEDMAKTGKMLLDSGRYAGRRVVPARWVEAMTSRHMCSVQGSPNSLEYIPTEADYANSDWVQGYGYQLWRCRHNAYRADGSFGQFIVVMPDVDAVVAMTADSHTYQKELDLLWRYILPYLEDLRQQ